MHKYLLSMICFVFVSTGSIQAQDIGATYFEDGLKEVNGTELYYKIMGEGEPIVILHGGPGLDHNHLEPSIGKLADEFQVIFYDQRGTGDSSADIDSADINIATFVEDLEALRKTFDLGKMNLLGVSWGSMLAMQYAITYPEHLNSLILGCPMGASSDFLRPFAQNLQERKTPEDSVALAQIRQTAAFKSYERKARNKASSLNFKPYFHPQKKHLAGKLKFNHGPNTFKNSGMVNSLIFPELTDYDIHEELKTVTSPTLVIHGDSDPIPPEFAERIHQAIPNSEFKLLKDTGHIIYIEAEDEFLHSVRNFAKKHKK